MKKARVVIGANFGDEGKGLMTDYFASEGDAIVIRFNGGGQAGHTVITKDKRHVFQHVGSGTLAGASTYLSRFFVTNPILFVREYHELEELGIKPIIYVDKKSLVTTPIEMMLNELIEDFRGAKKHGSCGVGLNETIRRNKYYPLTVEDLLTKGIPKFLKEIESIYVPRRLVEMGIVDPSSQLENFCKMLKTDGLIEQYMEDVEFFCSHVFIQEPDFSKVDNIVFEGAQGLCLDKDHHFFPYVTHSKTGLHNVAILAMQHKLSLDVVYVTRCYSTRHGAGPFPSEISGIPFDSVKDDTNKYGKFQGKFRFGWLDLDLQQEVINKDLLTEADVQSVSLAITCLDQISAKDVTFRKNESLYSKEKENFIEDVFRNIKVKTGFMCFGPSKDKVWRVEVK